MQHPLEREKTMANKKHKLKKDALWGYVFILVPLTTFIIFTLYPVISAAITSFQHYKPLKTTWVGFDNYVSTFKNALFYKALKNTLVYTVLAVPISMFLSFAISLFILPFKKRVQTIFKAAFYLPAIASGVALSFVWKWIYDPMPTGLLNSILHIFGISSQNWLGSSKTAMASLIIMAVLELPSQFWLGSSKTAMASLIIMAVFSGLGTSIIIYIAALLGIDSTYYEAADIDGASFFQKVAYGKADHGISGYHRCHQWIPVFPECLPYDRRRAG